jgi:transforming growth factor-beta-induced protein
LLDVANDNSDAFSSLAQFIATADLAGDLIDRDGITLFAPTNDAFAKFKKNTRNELADNLKTDPWQEHLEDLLFYHTLPNIVSSDDIIGGKRASETLNDEKLKFTLSKKNIGGLTVTDIFVNTDAQIIDADISIVNGIIHAIDDVLLPPWVSKNIVDTIESNPSKNKLETLVELLKDFDLNDQLSSPGPYTFFAPTNLALKKDIANGNDLSPDQLSSVLNYHVVEGIYPESVLVDGFTLETLQGETLTFKRKSNGTTKVKDETIITPNILANNGIVHVIDGVLIPEG